jgi:tetratricopeptide (TPR) repeat protein
MDHVELFKEAQILFMDEKYKESIEVFTRAIEAGADPYLTHLSRGVVYLKLKETDKALNDFNEAINANTQSARAYYFRGNVYLMKDEFEKAVSDFSKAMELKRGYFMARFSRGVAYARMNKLDEALADIKAVMPEMELNMQGFIDTHGIVRTELFKVMAQLSGDRPLSTSELGEKEINILKKWLSLDE